MWAINFILRSSWTFTEQSVAKLIADCTFLHELTFPFSLYRWHGTNAIFSYMLSVLVQKMMNSLSFMVCVFRVHSCIRSSIRLCIELGKNRMSQSYFPLLLNPSNQTTISPLSLPTQLCYNSNVRPGFLSQLLAVWSTMNHLVNFTDVSNFRELMNTQGRAVPGLPKFNPDRVVSRFTITT